MQAFAALLDGLIYTRSRDHKVRLIADYFRTTPDPDRGWALAALAGTLSISTVKAAAIRAMAEERFDPMLFRMSRDYVGDTAETVALMWPDVSQDVVAPTVSEVIDVLSGTSRARAPAVLAELMDRLDANGRYALLKLATGGMRVGISARLAKPPLGKPLAFLWMMSRRYGTRFARLTPNCLRGAKAKPNVPTPPIARFSGPSCLPIRWRTAM